jgi:hypothetical protein
MATISGCRHIKEIYIYVNSTTQRCPNKIITIFLLEGFFHYGIIIGLGETDSRKKPEAKNLVTLSL